jgi:hypothetical protein
MSSVFETAKSATTAYNDKNWNALKAVFGKILEIARAGPRPPRTRRRRGPFPPSKKRIELPRVQVIKSRAGGQDFTQYFDMATLLTQIGASRASPRSRWDGRAIALRAAPYKMHDQGDDATTKSR